MLPNCTRCGSEAHVDVKLAACGLRSDWKKENPLNTLNPIHLKTTYDGMRIWKIALCEACLIKGYLDYLQHRVQEAKNACIIGIVLFAVGLAISWVEKGVILKSNSAWSAPIGLMCLGFVLVGCFLSIYGCVRYLTFSKKLRKVKAGRIQPTLPPDKYDQAFLGEAERILNEHQKHHTGNAPSEFELPETKSMDSLTVEERKIVKFIRPFFEVLCVGDSFDEIEKKLSNEWRPVFQRERMRAGEL